MGIIKPKFNPVVKTVKRSFRIVFTPDDPKKRFEANKTGNVTNLEILKGLDILEKHYATEVLKDYVKETGDKSENPEKLGAWLNKKQK